VELRIYDADLTLLGVIDKIDSLIWSRRYWSCGDFKLLVPFTDRHIELLKMNRLIMKRDSDEAGEIRYIHIAKNSQGNEQIEVQGRFITGWLGKRIVLNQIVATASTQFILHRIVSENIVNPANTARRISNIHLTDISGISRPSIEYTSEMHTNALLACETAARASRLGFGIYTDNRLLQHFFKVYDGMDLTADQTVNPPCIFSQEFDNILEQEFTNSTENLRSTAYVGGEEREDKPRRIAEVGQTAAGLQRQEVFINAADIVQTFRNDQGIEITMPEAQYIEMLRQRGSAELEHYAETLSFQSKVNTHSNLQYKKDYNLGDRVTCVNKKWGIRINVRITEIAEIYNRDFNEINITFGESIPALIDTLRHLVK
jgi:hypothetical protein